VYEVPEQRGVVGVGGANFGKPFQQPLLNPYEEKYGQNL